MFISGKQRRPALHIT
uniref:Uncharacterized protein n=1 Tax=Rhizophora mucronata TaxID=61149 RepID=A0A2P2NEA7_RHIMU